MHRSNDLARNVYGAKNGMRLLPLYRFISETRHFKLTSSVWCMLAMEVNSWAPHLSSISCGVSEDSWFMIPFFWRWCLTHSKKLFCYVDMKAELSMLGKMVVKKETNDKLFLGCISSRFFLPPGCDSHSPRDERLGFSCDKSGSDKRASPCIPLLSSWGGRTNIWDVRKAAL